MVDLLKKEYGNVSNARAHVIKGLAELEPAKGNILSCEHMFDEIRSLVNEMVSTRYNILEVHDPMWTENILQKLPRNIVEEFLKVHRDTESCSIGQTLDCLKELIARYSQSNIQVTRETARREKVLSAPNPCAFCKKTNHKSFQCRTVAEPSARRQVVMENNLCWKCFSSEHKSNECKRSNCPHCSRLHDGSLCLRSSPAPQTPQASTNGTTPPDE
ncbi:zinc knuckle [Ostertagia ostertagi]